MISGWPKRAFVEPSRMSQASAISQPPPSAKPFTAAIVGLRIVSRRCAHSWPSSEYERASRVVIRAISAMSAPAMNARSPSPVRITTRASRSRPSAASVLWSSSSSSVESAFRTSGRLIVTVATWSSSRSAMDIGRSSFGYPRRAGGVG